MGWSYRRRIRPDHCGIDFFRNRSAKTADHGQFDENRHLTRSISGTGLAVPLSVLAAIAYSQPTSEACVPCQGSADSIGRTVLPRPRERDSNMDSFLDVAQR